MTTLNQRLAAIASESDRSALRAVLAPIVDRMSTRNLVSPALAIKAETSAVVASAAAIVALVKGVLVAVAAADMPALSGTVTNAYFNVFCFYVDNAGTVTSAMGQQATTLAGVKFPPQPEGKAMIGFVIINPTGTGNFVGGTTALDNATVVPNAVYVNVTGAFDPNALL